VRSSLTTSRDDEQYGDGDGFLFDKIARSDGTFALGARTSYHPDEHVNETDDTNTGAKREAGDCDCFDFDFAAVADTHTRSLYLSVLEFLACLGTFADVEQ